MHHPLVLTLDSTGAPNRWSSWEASVVYKVKDQIAWSIGDETIHYGGKSRMTGETSTVAVPSIIAIRNMSRVKNQQATLNRRNLYGRDRGICCFCGDHVDESAATKDHIMPVSRGGKNTWMNIVLACKSCNNRKDNRTTEEAFMPLLYLPYVPNRVEALILANRKILADQLDFLIAHLPKHSRLNS